VKKLIFPFNSGRRHYHLKNHSFVIKIWLEEIDNATGAGVWRGHIIHADSKMQRNFKNLDEILTFIRRYMKT
jgi:hypothetical protein